MGMKRIEVLDGWRGLAIILLLSGHFANLPWIWSFSIYLWQQPFYMYNWEISGPGFVGLFLAIICGTLSFYLYESPVRSLINKRWTRNV